MPIPQLYARYSLAYKRARLSGGTRTQLYGILYRTLLSLPCIQDTLSSRARLAWRLHLGRVRARAKVSCIQLLTAYIIAIIIIGWHQQRGIIKTVHIHIQLHYFRFFKQTFSESYFYYQLRFSIFPSFMGIIKTVHIHIQLHYFCFFEQTFSESYFYYQL